MYQKILRYFQVASDFQLTKNSISYTFIATYVDYNAKFYQLLIVLQKRNPRYEFRERFYNEKSNNEGRNYYSYRPHE